MGFVQAGQVRSGAGGVTGLLAVSKHLTWTTWPSASNSTFWRATMTGSQTAQLISCVTTEC